MIHLSDEQIQEYLDSKETNNKIIIESHLNNCEFCRMDLLAYKQVYHSLKESEPVPSFSNNLNIRIIKEIESKYNKKWNLIENGILALLFVFGILVGVYFLNLTEILSNFLMIDFSHIALWFKNIYINYSSNIIHLAAAMIIFFIIEIMDRIISNKIFRLIKF